MLIEVLMKYIPLMSLFFIFGCNNYESPRASYEIFMEKVNPVIVGSDYQCLISDWGIINCKVKVTK